MRKFIDKLRNSSFIINKIYLILAFLLILVQDITLGFYSFILSIIIFTWKTLKSKIPIKSESKYNKETYIYKETENKDLKMDIYIPDTGGNSYPLVYFCHGGGWISGFRNQPNNVSWCKYLVSKGFAVASIDYRFGYKNTMSDILSDYSDGLKYIKANNINLKIDKRNIVLMGLSAGGHLSLLYSSFHTYTDPNSEFMEGIRAVVGYYSPTRLKDLLDEDNKSLFAKFAMVQTIKGSPEEDYTNEVEKIYEYYSPINYLSKDMIPTLMVHGKIDNTVPFTSSVEFVKKLNELNIPNEFLVHKKADHSFDSRLSDYTTINIIEKTGRFIRSYIR